jgi:hypothetical protein
VLECGGCEGLSTAPLYSRSVRCDELISGHLPKTFASTTNLQHILFRSLGGFASENDLCYADR